MFLRREVHQPRKNGKGPPYVLSLQISKFSKNGKGPPLRFKSPNFKIFQKW